MWAKPGLASNQKWLIGDNDHNYIMLDSSGKASARVHGVGSSLTTTTYYDNTWHFFAFGNDGTNAFMMVDGENKTTWLMGSTNTNTEVKIGRRGTDALYYFQGTIDEIAIWNRNLSSTEISDMYSQVAVYPFYGNFSVTAKNAITSAVIGTFNISITGDKDYATTNGSITTDLQRNSTQLWNITFCAENYICKTYADVNVSNNLQAQLSPANTLTIQLYDEETNSKILNHSNLDLIDGTFAQNYTSETGNFSMLNLTSYYYELIYTSAGFNLRSYYQNLDETNANLTLYLLDSAKSVNRTEERRGGEECRSWWSQ